MFLKILFVLVLLIVILIGAIYLWNEYFAYDFEDWMEVRHNDLTSYSYSSGGGMLGGHSSRELRLQEYGTVLMPESRAETHSDLDEVHEYLLDKDVLQDIEAIFRKYHMERWNRKEFTKVFIADGESDSYHFRFGTAQIWFSSQVYPAKYANKLSKIDDAIRPYLDYAIALPGLIIPELTQEELYGLYYPEDGEVQLKVIGYENGYLKYYVLNGTDEEIAFDDAHWVLTREGDSEPLVDKTSPYSYPEDISPHGRCESSFRLDFRLYGGSYRLEADGLSGVFEIG